MSAVFGGIYCLRHSVHCLIVDKDTNRCKAVIDSRGQRISCSHVVVENSYLDMMMSVFRYLSRAVLITDSSVLPSDSDQQISVVTVPPAAAGGPSVKMVELCSSSMTCIPGTHLVHLTCQSVGSAHEDLSPLVTRMFRTTESQNEDQRPSVLWCLFFNMADGSTLEVEGHQLPSNVYVCCGPDGGLGHEHAVKQVRHTCWSHCSSAERFCWTEPKPDLMRTVG
uniref:Rab proteins geranylgeranyltransferase component A 1-like n=1 Tax=Fundulus heteroclitus TaxID=8078 RepID=A0A3Q2NTL8_FUNHE